MTRKAKQSITQQQALQLLGLKTLAAHLNRQLDAIKATALDITGEVDDDGVPYEGYTCDMIWDDNTSVDHALKCMDIKVL